MKHEYIQRKYFCSEVELQNIKKNHEACWLEIKQSVYWNWTEADPINIFIYIEHHIVMNCHHIMFYLEFNWLN